MMDWCRRFVFLFLLLDGWSSLVQCRSREETGGMTRRLRVHPDEREGRRQLGMMSKGRSGGGSKGMSSSKGSKSMGGMSGGMSMSMSMVGQFTTFPTFTPVLTTAPTVLGAPTVTPGAPTVAPGSPTVAPGAPTMTPGTTTAPGAPTLAPGTTNGPTLTGATIPPTLAATPAATPAATTAGPTLTGATNPPTLAATPATTPATVRSNNLLAESRNGGGTTTDATALGTNTGEATPSGPEIPGTLKVHTKFDFAFRPGQGQEPTTLDLDALIAETTKFFTDEFTANADFQATFAEFSLADVTSVYDGTTSPDEFVLEALATVRLSTTETTLTNADAANVMADSDFNNYIGTYLHSTDAGQWNEFQQTHKVSFTGWGS